MGNLSSKNYRPVDNEITHSFILSNQANLSMNIKQIYNSCTMCLGPFGIQDERVPHICINIKCGRLYCAQCVNFVKRHNGNSKRFRCMFCLFEYSRDQAPKEYELLKQQLWTGILNKYGIRYTQYLLSTKLTQYNRIDLWNDIECRRRHLLNLISTLERHSRCTQSHNILTQTHIMAENLMHISTRLKSEPNYSLDTCQNEYKNIISPSDNNNDQDIGSLYIRECEHLLSDIADAEFYRAFAQTYVKMNQWICDLASNSQFQPQICDLVEAINNDLNDQFSGDRHGIVRAKIGIIGYTCVGKSTLTNRFLGVTDLNNDSCSPVRSMKSTYYQLQFDRKEPLFSPDNSCRQTGITLVDIQGHDSDIAAMDSQIEPGNYFDEIRKADCDIYILVFNEKLRYEQHRWITFIEETLKRKCILVRSKVDIEFLAKFRERAGVCYGNSELTERSQLTPIILEQMKLDNTYESHKIYFIAADYLPSSSDAKMLLEDHPFDMPALFEDLGHLVFDSRIRRIHMLAMRAVARVINTCFRRGYVVNVLNYKIGAGVAAIIPFGDQLPRYLARDHIRQAFGITQEFRQYLLQYRLSIDDGCLQTSSLENCVTATMIKSKKHKHSLGTVVGGAFIASAPFSDDILRAAAPAAIVATGTARIALTASTAVIGVVISCAICAWSAIDSGKHIFSYVNRLCDDIILVCNPLMAEIINLHINRYEHKH